MLYILAQTAMLVCWYTLPAMASLPLWIVFAPMIVWGVVFFVFVVIPVVILAMAR